jgi:hypothetical protein
MDRSGRGDRGVDTRREKEAAATISPSSADATPGAVRHPDVSAHHHLLLAEFPIP